MRMLALRNRKQTPFCHTCHRYVIHGGRYKGPSLSRLVNKTTDKLVDNRIIHLESFVKPRDEDFSNTLEERL